jgi:hypothetical protein
MFVAACKGKDGNLWSIRLSVETFEQAWNIVEQLGLDVAEEDLGVLIAEFELGDGRIQEQVLAHVAEDQVEMALAEIELFEATIEKGEKTH